MCYLIKSELAIKNDVGVFQDVTIRNFLSTKLNDVANNVANDERACCHLPG